MVPLFTTGELEKWLQVDSGTLDPVLGVLLHDTAVGYLEGETGVKLVETTATVTYTPRWDDCWIDLPVPLREVTEVSIDGTVVESDDYQVVNNRLYRRVGWGGSRWTSDHRFAYRSVEDDHADVAVTMTFGFPDGEAPAEFKTWGLVLAGQAYRVVPRMGLQSFRIDDYAETYATGGALPYVGLALPPQILGRLKARYGRGVAVVESR